MDLKICIKSIAYGFLFFVISISEMLAWKEDMYSILLKCLDLLCIKIATIKGQIRSSLKLLSLFFLQRERGGAGEGGGTGSNRKHFLR
jgi:hypothetical protein